MENFDYTDFIIKKENIREKTLNRHRSILAEHNNILVTEEKWIQNVIKEQKQSLEEWIDFLKKRNLPTEIQIWILESIKKMGRYNRQKEEFTRRNKHTIHPFAETNFACISKAIENQNISFKKAYEEQLSKIFTEKSCEGIWKQYKSSEENIQIRKDLQGYFTSWCLMSENVSYLHLLEGNIHIFYTMCSLGYVYPRIAIRTKGNKVAWISGIEPNQGIERELKPQVIKHIENSNLLLEEELERKLLKENRNYF